MLAMIRIDESRFVREVIEGGTSPIIRGRRIHSAALGWTDGVFALAPLAERPLTPGKVRVEGAQPAYTVRERDVDWSTWDVEKVWPEIDPLPPPTDEERIDEAFPGTDTARVIFEAFFEIANEIRALKSQSALTRAQLRNWLKAKLP